MRAARAAKCRRVWTSLKHTRIACLAAKANGGIVAPPDYWHIHEIGGYAIWSRRRGRPPTAHLADRHAPLAALQNICYHIRAADALGFHAAILLTGHYGPNWEDLNELVRLLQPFVGTRLYSSARVRVQLQGLFGRRPETGDHAGKVETSLLWALRPGVRGCLAHPGAVPARETSLPWAKNAYQANRQPASAWSPTKWSGWAQGRELLDEYDRLQPPHNFTTFETVERVWQEVITPRLPNFKTMQEKWEGQADLPADSPWRRNNQVPDNWK